MDLATHNYRRQTAKMFDDMDADDTEISLVFTRHEGSNVFQVTIQQGDVSRSEYKELRDLAFKIHGRIVRER